MKIVISGSTGNIGQQLISMLDFKEHEYFLITRDKNKLLKLEGASAKLAEGSLFDEAFLTQTLTGADVYFFLPPPNFQSENMVEEYRELAEVSKKAAQAAGVKRILHLSTLGGAFEQKRNGINTRPIPGRKCNQRWGGKCPSLEMWVLFGKLFRLPSNHQGPRGHLSSRQRVQHL